MDGRTDEQANERTSFLIFENAEIQTRGSFRGDLTKEEFDRQRLIVNDLLKQRYDRHFVEFKDVVFPIDYDDDLVHMDMTERRRRNSGMRKFQHRVRRIFCTTDIVCKI